MSKTKQVRCPHCRGINTVNSKKELSGHQESILRGINKPAAVFPETIIAECSHCGESFKIKT